MEKVCVVKMPPYPFIQVYLCIRDPRVVNEQTTTEVFILFVTKKRLESQTLVLFDNSVTTITAFVIR